MTPTSLSTPIRPAVALSSLSATKKLLLLACNAISLLHAITIGAAVWFLCHSPWVCVSVALAIIYLLPPLLCRWALLLLPIRQQVIPVGSRDFFVWWFALNLQLLFCRLRVLEELLRIVPGCYSLWLRLWGAKIGKLTYWAAGVQILDRSFLRIGNHVTFGAGVRLNPHVMLPDAQGQMVLVLATITIGDRANVGGYSLLVAGAEIAAGECTQACLILPPFNRVEGGRRRKPVDASLALHEQRLGIDAV